MLYLYEFFVYFSDDTHTPFKFETTASTIDGAIKDLTWDVKYQERFSRATPRIMQVIITPAFGVARLVTNILPGQTA